MSQVYLKTFSKITYSILLSVLFLMEAKTLGEGSSFNTQEKDQGYILRGRVWKLQEAYCTSENGLIELVPIASKKEKLAIRYIRNTPSCQLVDFKTMENWGNELEQNSGVKRIRNRIMDRGDYRRIYEKVSKPNLWLHYELIGALKGKMTFIVLNYSITGQRLLPPEKQAWIDLFRNAIFDLSEQKLLLDAEKIVINLL